MLNHAEIEPLLACQFEGGNVAIPGLVEDVLAQRHVWCGQGNTNPEMLELLGLALNEVLHTIVEFSGVQRPEDNACVELWADKNLVILSVRFSGRDLPDWLLTNWDRGQEPALLAPPHDLGWGWLLVREALDSVHITRSGDRQMLFLEKRF